MAGEARHRTMSERNGKQTPELPPTLYRFDPRDGVSR